jgi:hypothetical protein
MDYRVRYREIPWGVAICVLPGKVIGRCVLDPVLHVKKYPVRILKKIARFIVVVFVLVALCTCGVLLADKLTEGQFGEWIRVELLDKAPITENTTPEHP